MSGAVIVTGASSGIGLATARLLGERGYDVGITYRSGERAAQALADELRGLGCRAEVVALDLDDPGAADAAVAALGERLGTPVALVNNAAIDHRGRLVDDELDAWERILRVDLLGPVAMARAVARAMIAGGTGGAIVNVTSVLDRLPVAGGGAYCAAKAGLALATEVMALELAEHGIRVNAVAPGHTSTPQNFGPKEIDPRAGVYPEIPAGRPAQAREVAAAIAYLLSADAAYLTGSRLLADGGLTLVSGPQTLESAVEYEPQTPESAPRGPARPAG